MNLINPNSGVITPGLTRYPSSLDQTKVARTIADLAACAAIVPERVSEAIQYRSLDRQIWG